MWPFYLPVLAVWFLISVLALALVVKCFLKAKLPKAPLPSVAFLVPVYNDKVEDVKRMIDSIEAQRYSGKFTVVLVDDCSDLPLESWVRHYLYHIGAFHDYKVIRTPHNTGRKSLAMNHGLPLVPAKTQVLAVLDGDTYLRYDAIFKAVYELWANPRYGAVSGVVFPANAQKGLLSWLIRQEHSGVYAGVKYAQGVFGRVGAVAGAFSVHRMEAIRDVGDWRDWVVEDITWTWVCNTKGWLCGYACSAIAYTQVPTTYKGLFNQRRRWARGRLEAVKASWAENPLHTLTHLPWFMLWCLQLAPPTFLILLLAGFAGDWWLFGFLGLSWAMYTLMAAFNIWRLPKEDQPPLRDAFVAPVACMIFEFYLWVPHFLGMLDEALNRKKNWLTR